MNEVSKKAATAVAKLLARWDHIPDDWPDYLADAQLILLEAAKADDTP